MVNQFVKAFFKGKLSPRTRALSWITAFAIVGTYMYFTRDFIEEFKTSDISSWNHERMEKLKRLEVHKNNEK